MKLTLKFLYLAICSSLLLTSSCQKESVPLPEISITGASIVRSVTDASLVFELKLSKPATNNVSVDYSTTDATAVSGRDFVAASGTVTIAANQSLAKIEVQIKGDPLNTRQPNLGFALQLSNPKNCTIPDAPANGTIITEDGTYLLTDNTGYTTPLTYPGYSLVWSDEFTENLIDDNIWNHEIGNGSSGWGNNELEYYTNSVKNSFISNGNLIIEARNQAMSGFAYTSARMTTQNKKSFTFGRIDIRAKLPVGKGIWPALWMLGTNINTAGWPACGEIDIMELVGNSPTVIRGTMHWKTVAGASTNKGENYTLASGDFSQEFHVFSIIWTKDNISWYVDDQMYLSNSASDVGSANYPFNADQFFIFNVAVGGNWPGSPDNTTTFPKRMFVDYIRVFQ
jgi:beta-glucanase (GH16 family)